MKGFPGFLSRSEPLNHYGSGDADRTEIRQILSSGFGYLPADSIHSPSR
ncbi:Uncharacterized protein dnm_030420 [Desulfonema magnum]|uniref:Uncharacterized protein n=1 Tax=Desulfonema magnum TaxID=45655 RepID=A0A975GMS3_9BACT|nr:Uncharacterized protein dnm_030420 [Desulfonema magnum]